MAQPPVSPKQILSAPPKPVEDMSEAEIGAWADEIFDEMKSQRPAVEKAAKHLKSAD